MIFLLAPHVTGKDAHDVLDLIEMLVKVTYASTEDEAIIAMEAFVEEANALVAKLTAKYAGKSVPLIGQVIGVADSIGDAKTIAENTGCHLLP